MLQMTTKDFDTIVHTARKRYPQAQLQNYKSATLGSFLIRILPLAPSSTLKAIKMTFTCTPLIKVCRDALLVAVMRGPAYTPKPRWDYGDNVGSGLQL